MVLNRKDFRSFRGPATSLALFILSSVLLSASLSGYGFEAWGKAYLEAICILLLGVILLTRSMIRGTYCSHPNDRLLLVPVVGYLLAWSTDHYLGASSIVHPAIIFVSCYATVSALRQLTNSGIQIVTKGLVLGACGSATMHLIGFQSTMLWLSASVDGNNLIFPLFRWLQHGGFAQPNVFGTFLATTALLAYYLSAESQENQKQIQPLFLTCAIFLSFVSSTLASLTTNIGLIVGFAFLIAILKLRNKSPSRYLVAYIALFAIAVLGGVNTKSVSQGQGDSAVSVLSEKLSTETVSSKCRLSFLDTSWQMLRDNPLMGSGLNAFSITHKLLTEGSFEKKASCNSDASHPHNIIAAIAGELGIIGILFIIGPLALWFLSTARSNWMLASSILMPMLLHTQTELPLNMSMLHWFAGALITILLYSSPSQTKPTSAVAVVMPFACASIGLIFALSVAFSSINAAIEFWRLKKTGSTDQLSNLVVSPFRNHPTFQHKYDRLIGVNACRLAITNNDLSLAKTFAPVLERGLAHLATIEHLYLLARVQKQFPQVLLKWNYQPLLE